MSPKEIEAKQIWLQAAEKRLNSLCTSFVARSEDYDVLPTEKQKRTVIDFLVLVDQADAPKIGTTINADITLMWVTAGDKYKVYVARDGSQLYFHNKRAVEQHEFLSLVARVLA